MSKTKYVLQFMVVPLNKETSDDLYSEQSIKNPYLPHIFDGLSEALPDLKKWRNWCRKDIVEFQFSFVSISGVSDTDEVVNATQEMIRGACLPKFRECESKCKQKWKVKKASEEAECILATGDGQPVLWVIASLYTL